LYSGRATRKNSGRRSVTDPQRRAALDRADRAADGTQDIDVAGNAGADGEIGRHADKLAVEILLLEILEIPRDEEIDGSHAAARIADANPFGRGLREQRRVKRYQQ
jgi:hypothetical protein